MPLANITPSTINQSAPYNQIPLNATQLSLVKDFTNESKKLFNINSLSSNLETRFANVTSHLFSASTPPTSSALSSKSNQQWLPSIVTSLNADAPEFHPNKIQSHNHFFTNKPLPKIQPHQLFYTTCPPPTLVFYPTTNKHPFYSPFRFHPTYQLTKSDPKPNYFHFPTGMEKNELKSVEASGGSKVMDDLCSGRVRFPRFEWRRKGERKDQRKTHVVRDDEQYFYRPLHHKMNRRGRGRFPVVPVRPDGEETTVMIKNIPSKYNRDMLVEFLEDHCNVENAKEKENGEESTFAFDFVYLPIDFRTGLNKGYAFVNFTKAKAAWKFLLTASKQKWELFLSPKIRDVVAARLQGKEKLVYHFETMNFPCASEDVLPLCFSPPRDGIIKGNQWTIGKVLYKPAF
ncbi:MEI2 protein [Trifolium repens]|nr:MEI2 protein [Trifolium repens]